MTDETDNAPNGATDNVNTQADDMAENWDYFDPDDDQDTEAAPETEATDDGIAEADEATEPAEEAEEAPEVEAAPDAVVTLADGTKAKVSDLAQGYLRQQDYSRKTQEIANTRKDLQAKVQSLESTVQAFVDHLSGLVPEPPPPSLALTNPGQYTAQKAQYEAALAQVQKLVEFGQTPKNMGAAMSKEDRAALIAEETRKLAERFPETATAEGRQKFFTEAAEVASDLGFSMEELGQITDHRIFALARYARLGMKAEEARKSAAKKVENVPPVSRRRPAENTAANRNREAMNRLNRTGSIRDAVKVDWD